LNFPSPPESKLPLSFLYFEQDSIELSSIPIFSKSLLISLNMHPTFFLPFLTLIHAQETVLGVFILHRHGDRTSKSFAPTTLTDLGYNQVYDSGSYYRDRYISSNASSQIYNISPDVVKTSQLSVEAPVDTVLQNSAAGFLQGLYPPVQKVSTLANGTTVGAPLGGYQLIPVNAVASASSSANSENSAWLQGKTCFIRDFVP
jgi:hypothetical protein